MKSFQWPWLVLLLLLIEGAGRADCISFKKIYTAANVKLNKDDRGTKRTSNRDPFIKKSDKSSAFLKRSRSKVNSKDLDLDAGEDEDGPRIYDFDEVLPDGQKTRVPGRRQISVISKYTTSPGMKTLVSLLSGIVSMLGSAFLSMMLFSTVWWGLVKFCFMTFFISGFTNTIVGDLSRSMGVFLLLLLQQSWLKSFFKDIFKLLTATVGLTKRHPFPPSTSPWKYERVSPKDPDFNMYRTLITLLLMGSYLGRVISCFLPLVPTWIDVLVAGIGTAYMGTLVSPRGDLTSMAIMVFSRYKYAGFGVVASVGNMRAVANEVALFSNLEVVWNRVVSFVTRLNYEHGIVEKSRIVTGQLMNQISLISNRLKADMTGAPVVNDEGESGGSGINDMFDFFQQ